jgi:hypothetical protein
MKCESDCVLSDASAAASALYNSACKLPRAGGSHASHCAQRLRRGNTSLTSNGSGMIPRCSRRQRCLISRTTMSAGATTPDDVGGHGLQSRHTGARTPTVTVRFPSVQISETSYQIED